jgi:sulfite dehydrogenase (cytochrome) subunit B
MIRLSAAALAGAVSVFSMAVAAQPARIAIPFGETPPELVDAEVVVANCSGCHSLDYITTQPRGKGAQFWRDAVTKMATVYKAQLTAEDAEQVSAVLARKFG